MTTEEAERLISWFARRRRVHCQNGNVVERFYSRGDRSSVAVVKNQNGDQVGDAEYGDARSVSYAMALMVKWNGGERSKISTTKTEEQTMTKKEEAEARAASNAAARLGRMAGGKPKKFSKAEIKRRTQRLVEARAKRWQGHTKKATKPNQTLVEVFAGESK